MQQYEFGGKTTSEKIKNFLCKLKINFILKIQRQNYRLIIDCW